MSPEEYMLYCPNWLPAGGNFFVFHVSRESQPHHVLTHDHPPQLSPGQDPDSLIIIILGWDIYSGSCPYLHLSHLPLQ